MAHHTFMDGRLHLYKRDGESRYWQCSAYIQGKNWRASTKLESFDQAKDFAEDWYLRLRGKKANGELRVGKTFKDAADRFLLEYPIITAGERNQSYSDGKGRTVRVHLMPFFGDKLIHEITSGVIQDYRLQRLQNTERTGKAPARSTLHQEIVCLRQILKCAHRQGWIQFVPDMSSPYKSSGKITHRAWFSPEEYNLLVDATRRRALHPLNNRHRQSCEQLHDFVLIMANTGLRPDEAFRLEYRDVAVSKDDSTREKILEIEVRGKRGVGWCKSMPGAVMPFERMMKRNQPQRTDRLFPSKHHHRELLNTILGELEMKRDRDGNVRTAYSLRHTYICFRLMEGADIYQIAKNCRTSVEMIEKYYAAHIKNMLDTAAINVRRKKPRRTATRADGRDKPAFRRSRKAA
ncbi:MAG: tyrosine-type recombinase/integrase [Pseudomonadota bacterium]